MGLQRGKTTATSNADVTKLPTRFARLTGHFAIILVRKPFAATAPAASTISATTTISARAAVAGAASRTARAARFGLGPGFVNFQVAAPRALFRREQR